MEEVIAKKSLYSLGGYIASIIAGVTLIVVSVIVYPKEEESLIMYVGIGVGALFLAVGIYFLIRFFLIPSKVVVYKDGVLYLHRNASCKPEELEEIFIGPAKRGFGAALSYGRLVLTVHGKTYKYNDIENIKSVQDRLLQLRRAAMEQLYAQKMPEKASSNK